jgi:hypothetical protein
MAREAAGVTVYRSSGSVTIPSFSTPALRTSAMTFTTNP